MPCGKYAVMVLPTLCAAVSRALQLVRESQLGTDCRTAANGDACHRQVTWAMQIGIHENPRWYGNLTAQSTAHQFQQHLHDHFSEAGCEAPCESTDAPSAPFVDEKLVAIEHGEATTNNNDLTSQSTDNCRTVVEGDACHRQIVWAMQLGIRENPAWYRGLTPSSTADQFQQHLHDHVPKSTCPAPCKPQESSASAFFRKMTTVEQKNSTTSTDLNSSKSEHGGFSAAGLQRTLELNDPTALEEYVERLIQSDGREVRSRSGLKDFVEQTLQRTDLKRDLWVEDYEIFRTKVRSVAWVDPGIGRMAALTAPGYEQVAATYSRQQTANFCRRMIDKMGKAVIDETKFVRTLTMLTTIKMTFEEVVAMMAVGSFAQAK